VTASGLTVAFLVSFLAPLVEALLPGVPLVRGSHAALALAPWLVAALLPPRASEHARGARSVVLLVAAWSLPALGLGIGLDAAAGAGAAEIVAGAGTGWLVLVLWSTAAARARSSEEARRAYGWIWLLAVPGLAAWHAAFAFGAARAESDGEPVRLLAVDPWIWWHQWARTTPGSPPALLAALAALVGALLACLGVARLAGRAGSAG